MREFYLKCNSVELGPLGLRQAQEQGLSLRADASASAVWQREVHCPSLGNLSAGQARKAPLQRDGGVVDVAPDGWRERFGQVRVINNLGGARQEERLSQFFGE